MKMVLNDEKRNTEADEGSFVIPNKYFFNLKDCCELKGLNYKTACNRKWMQPNRGIEDGTVGGRKVWSYRTVSEWVRKTDSEI